MPTWASVLIALGSGGFAAWLTTRNDRRDRFRHRLIEAADEFASAAAAALMKTREAIHDANTLGVGSTLAWEHRDNVLRHSARIDLLFGPRRAASQRANDVLSALAKVAFALMPPSPDPQAAVRAHLAVTEALSSFSLAAADAIGKGKPPAATPLERLRRRISKRSRGIRRR